MKRALIGVLDCCFLLRIPLLVPVWTILLLGWITGSPSAGVAWPSLRGAWLSMQSGPPVLWTALIGFSFIVASIYVVNQIADIESDRINHKLFLLPHGLISVGAAWALAAACLVGGIVVAPRTGAWVETQTPRRSP